MGFFKFLKKGKEEKKVDESLDIPPPPPIINKKPESDLPEFTFSELPHPDSQVKDEKDLKFYEYNKKPPMPKKSPLYEFEDKISELHEKDPGLDDLSFPLLDEKPKFTPKPPVEKHEVEHIMPKKEEPIKHEVKVEPKHEENKEISVPLPTPIKREMKGPIYIKLENYKTTIKNIDIIRSDLKKSEKAMSSLISEKGEVSKDFEKWHNTLEDIQKRLMFIEKIIIKGD